MRDLLDDEADKVACLENERERLKEELKKALARAEEHKEKTWELLDELQGYILTVYPLDKHVTLNLALDKIKAFRKELRN